MDIFPAIETYDGVAYRIEFWDDVIDRISSFNPVTGEQLGTQDELDIYPANLFVTDKATISQALVDIAGDLQDQLAFLKEAGKFLEAKTSGRKSKI